MFRNLPAASPYANFRSYWDSKPGFAALPRMLFADQKTYLVELLMKQDQMSMATQHRKPRARSSITSSSSSPRAFPST